MASVPLIFQFSSALLSALDTFLKTKIHCEGEENITDQPTLFVVNHFTRIETFVLPHVIYKLTGQQVHSLADHTLFGGKFGSFLESLGAFSTKHTFRNRKIISELMTGKYNWVIFPEGIMVKNKQIFEKGRLMLNNPERKGPPYTGASVLGLKAEMMRRFYLESIDRGEKLTENNAEKRYELKDPNELCSKEIVITPVNITYYPLRPERNILNQIASKILGDVPDRIDEELQVEGNILFSDSDINIYFDEPIPLGKYVNPVLPMARKYFPFVSRKSRTDLLLWIQKQRLTRYFMRRIYSKLSINIDHLFCMGLKILKNKKRSRDDFCRVLYLTAAQIRNQEGRRIHPTLEEGLLRIVSDEVHPPYDDIEKMALEENVLFLEDDHYRVDAKVFSTLLPFESIRLTSMVKVISNEAEPLKNVIKIVKSHFSLKPKQLSALLQERLLKEDQQRFDEDYKLYYDEALSKPTDVGRPFMLEGTNDVGIVLSHGYLAAPAEIRDLADYLNSHGYTVYGINLRGHGTAPRHFQDISYQDWVHSFNRGYAIIKNSCKHIVCVGFSAGGLLSLLGAANKSNHVKAVFCINAALKLQDIKTHLVPTVVMWNELLDKFKIESGKYEYSENESESPDINYSQNYLKGVLELENLIDVCHDCLPKVTAPTLILQSEGDPVVNPSGAETIISKIGSSEKRLEMLDFQRHIIVRGEGRELVFEKILAFLKNVQAGLNHQ